jgi:fatty acid desaturase
MSVWNIYGKKYDLTKLIDIHPGGKDVLLLSCGEHDLTVIFETYHAFSNKEKILKWMEQYEIIETVENVERNKQYDFTNYHILTNRIKTKLGFTNRELVKSNIGWVIQNTIILLLYGITFYNAMFSSYSILLRSLLGSIAGLSYMSLLFTAMHHASHFALSINPKVNNGISKLLNGFGLWNSNIWFYHHVINHHSFTGEIGKDPDLYHLNPFLNKTIIKTRKQILHDNANYIPYILTFFPGQYLGQCLSYLVTTINHKIFRIKIPDHKIMYDTVDICLYLLKLYFLYYGMWMPTICYIISLNFWYHINVVLDHDTYETVENHYHGNDWLKLQVCNSGNFLNGNYIWTRLFGGINYQIEHHLFPNMSNIHYPKIAPIVHQFCIENNIPYVNHTNLWIGYKSWIKMLRIKNNG